MAQAELVRKAVNVFTGDFIDLINGIRREKEQKIDHDNLDEVITAEWDEKSIEKAARLVQEFVDYLKENKNDIIALEIFFDQPYRRRDVTYSMIRSVMDKLKSDKPKLAPFRIWQAYSQLDNYQAKQPEQELTALVSLIRKACEVDVKLQNYESTVRKNFQNWIMKYHAGAGTKFNEEQMQWLHMIRDHVISSFHIEREDLEMAPFDSRGGLGKMYQLFGSDMDQLIELLNEELVA